MWNRLIIGTNTSYMVTCEAAVMNVAGFGDALQTPGAHLAAVAQHLGDAFEQDARWPWGSVR